MMIFGQTISFLIFISIYCGSFQRRKLPKARFTPTIRLPDKSGIYGERVSKCTLEHILGLPGVISVHPSVNKASFTLIGNSHTGNVLRGPGTLILVDLLPDETKIG